MTCDSPPRRGERRGGVVVCAAGGTFGGRAVRPTVHGAGNHGFVAVLVATVREKGVSAYIGDGTNRWPAVHRLDAGRLASFAVQNAPAGSVLHGVAEVLHSVAEAIGRGLRVPIVLIPAEQAEEHFSWLGRFFGSEAPPQTI